jgi:hypothetical protein
MAVKQGEVFILLGFIVLSLLSIFTSSGSIEIEMNNGQFGPDNYSAIINAVLLIICIIQLIVIIKKRQIVETEKKLDAETKKTIAVMVAEAICYTLGISYIGFYVSTFIFVILAYLTLEKWAKSRLVSAVIFACGLNVVFYFIFTWLHIYLPESLLF